MAERRRGAELERALLDAAWAELVEHGFARFTMDAVAARAGTSPPVLYRRWSDRHALLRAATAHAVEHHAITIPDTGSLRGDMLAFLRDANETRTELVAVVSANIGTYYQETGSSPADLRKEVLVGKPDVVETIFQRAEERGEIDPEHVTARMKTLPFDLMRAEFLMTLRPLSDESIEEIIDTLFLPLVRPGRSS